MRPWEFFIAQIHFAPELDFSVLLAAVSLQVKVVSNIPFPGLKTLLSSCVFQVCVCDNPLALIYAT